MALPINQVSMNVKELESNFQEENPEHIAKYLQLILESTGEGIYSVDNEGRCTYINRSGAEMLGYKPSELIGKIMHDIAHYKYKDGSLYNKENCPIYNSFKNGVSYTDSDEMFWKRDGTSFNVAFSSYPTVINGKRKGAIVNFIDNTNQKNTADALKISENRYKTLIEYSPDGIFLIQNDKIIYCNNIGAKILGFKNSDEAIGKEFRNGIKPIFKNSRLEKFNKAIKYQKSILHDKMKMCRKDGSKLYVDFTSIPILNEKDNLRQIIIRDITHDSIVNKMIEKREARFRALIEHSNDAIALFDKSGNTIYAGPTTEKVLGYTPSEFLQYKFTDLIHPYDLDVFLKRRDYIMTHPKIVSVLEFKILHKDGSWRWIESTQSNLFKVPDINAIVINYSDITKKKESEEKINHLAFYDQLTGLPNRRLFEDRLKHNISIAKRNGALLGVMFIDLDRFKNVNDTLGHKVGDNLLKQIAQRLKSILRETDTVSRQGGDEFTIILADIRDKKEAEIVAEKIFTVLSDVFNVNGNIIHITPSIGISFYPLDAEDPNKLIMYADAAMYAAKKQSGFSYQFYKDDVYLRVLERLNMENELRLSIRKDELVLFYQPKVDLMTGKVIGMESLLRWNHPILGLVPPDRFIPMAEEVGIINEIGEWVLMESFVQTRKWHDKGYKDLNISVNVSIKQVNKRFVEVLKEIVLVTKIAPCNVELEITESEISQNEPEVLEVLREVKKMGFTISIDDFGTGFSSLNRISSLPIDVLKIDKSFINFIKNDNNDPTIVKSIIAIAHSLKLKVIAEGVENQEQIDFLKKLKCDAIQGYLISPPVPAEEFIKLLDKVKYTMIN